MDGRCCQRWPYQQRQSAHPGKHDCQQELKLVARCAKLIVGRRLSLPLLLTAEKEMGNIITRRERVELVWQQDTICYVTVPALEFNS